MSTSEAVEEEVLFGVSLPALARVHAAERAGVSVEERLSELRLDRAAFSRGEQAWSERLARCLAEDPALFVRYDAALSEALAEGAPRIVPLEDDLGAWVSFEGHFQRALEPAAVAEKVGLTLAEVARLHRGWAERLAADRALAEEAVRKRAEEPAPLPEVKREPRVARRAAADRAVATPGTRERLAEAIPALVLPVAVPVAVAAPAGPPSIVSPGISPSAAPPMAVSPWSVAPGTASRGPGSSPPPAEASPPMTTGTGEINLASLLKGPLPFDPNAPRSAPPSPPAAPVAAPRREALFTGTGAVDLSKLRGGVVPFAKDKAAPDTSGEPSVPPVAAPHSSYSGAAQPSQGSTETGELDLRVLFGGGAPLPFQKGEAHDSRAPLSPPAPPEPPREKRRLFDSETAEVDPAVIAAALKKGPAPFKK